MYVGSERSALTQWAEKAQKFVFGWLNKGQSGGTWTDFGAGQQAGCKDHGEDICIWEQSQKYIKKNGDGEIAGLCLSSFFQKENLTGILE